MGDWTPPEKRFSSLGRRLLTAAVLIPVGLGVVWEGGWWVFAAVMAWEWSNMCAHPRAVFVYTTSAAFCVLLPLHLPWLLAFLALAGIVFTYFTARGSCQDKSATVAGWLYVTGMAAGLWLLREGPWDGRAAALYFMSFVWASDAAAYFVGRGLGGPRLLPQESPNKTWSGAAGAILITCICGFAASDVEQVSVGVWMVWAAALSVVAQLGDLLESGLKRRYHVKDSSGLLPGHGGVLDRVDGLGAVAVVGSLLLLLFPALRTALGLAQ